MRSIGKKDYNGINFNDIKILAFDIDGVLTDGKIFISESGIETKSFFANDGAGIKLAKKLGLLVGFISARISNASKIRADELGVDFYIEGCKDKLTSITSILEGYNLCFKNLFYMGDDIVDIELLKRAGVSASVPNAAIYVQKYANFITKKKGGMGAVREVCDIILEKNGMLQKFLVKFESS